MKNALPPESPLNRYLVRSLALLLVASWMTACQHPQDQGPQAPAPHHHQGADTDSSAGGGTGSAGNGSGSSGFGYSGKTKGQASDAEVTPERIRKVLSVGRQPTPLTESMIALYSEKNPLGVNYLVGQVIDNLVFEGDPAQTSDRYTEAILNVKTLKAAHIFSPVLQERTTTLNKLFNEHVERLQYREVIRTRQQAVLIAGVTLTGALAVGFAPKLRQVAMRLAAESPEFTATAEEGAARAWKLADIIPKSVRERGYAVGAKLLGDTKSVIANRMVDAGLHTKEHATLAIRALKFSEVPTDLVWTETRSSGLQIAFTKISDDSPEQIMFLRGLQNPSRLDTADYAVTRPLEADEIPHFVDRLGAQTADAKTVILTDKITGDGTLSSVPSDAVAATAKAEADAAAEAGEAATRSPRPKVVRLDAPTEGVTVDSQPDHFAATTTAKATDASSKPGAGLSSALASFDAKAAKYVLLNGGVGEIAFALGASYGQKSKKVPGMLYLDSDSEDVNEPAVINAPTNK